MVFSSPGNTINQIIWKKAFILKNAYNFTKEIDCRGVLK